MDLTELKEYALNEVGFSHVGDLNVDALEFLPEVRDMCEAGRCHAYGQKWTCPPACGTLEEIAEKARQFSCGIIVQSTGEMEDDFDVETMMETEQTQKARFSQLLAHVRELGLECLPMSSGACTVCEKCTYPDAPCRFPDKAIPSMEAYGLFVSKVCEQSGIKYNYGKQTITYIGCILFK